VKKNRKRFAFLCAVLLVATVLVQPLSAFADTPYHTFTRDSWGDLVLTQSAYAPWKVIGKELYLDNPEEKESPRFSPLSNPSDLFVTENDEIYVADTGNNRVVQMDIDGRLVRILEVKEKPLNKPQGVFVTPAGQIYIADTGNNRVVLLDAAGRYVREFGRPDSKFIPDMYKFDPTKLVVDKRGFLYIVTLGGYQGMLQLDPQGTFQGFFGTNQAQLSFADRLKKLFYTKEMYARELSKLPGSINSAAIDKDGFIYTVSSGENITQHQLKKLNFAGENLINKADEYAINHRGSEELSFGEMRGRDSVQQRPPKLIDVAVSPNGNMTVIDGEHQYISQYDAYGNLLFFWSGSSMASALQTGLPKSPVAIESLSDNTLLIADSQEGIVHLYKPTEFGNLIFEANQLTLEGKYEESESLWQEALRFHANFPNAQLGLAKAAFKRGDMKLAQSLFREAGIQKGYSDAFWRIRLASFQHNFSWIATILLAAGIAFVLLDRYARRISLLQRLRYRKKREFALVAQLRHALYIAAR
jgi:tetratricopeptide (TPR) repeat protein